MRASEVGVFEMRLKKEGALEMRLGEEDAFEMRPGEVGAPQVGRTQIDAPAKLPLTRAPSVWLKTMMNVSRYRASGMIHSSGMEAMSVVM